MRVTHQVPDGPRLAELSPGSGIVKVEDSGVMLLDSFGAHGAAVEAIDSSDLLDVSDADIAVRDRILAGRDETRRRMLAAGMSEPDVAKCFGGAVLTASVSVEQRAE